MTTDNGEQKFLLDCHFVAHHQVPCGLLARLPCMACCGKAPRHDTIDHAYPKTAPPEQRPAHVGESLQRTHRWLAQTDPRDKHSRIKAPGIAVSRAVCCVFLVCAALALPLLTRVLSYGGFVRIFGFTVALLVLTNDLY
jgi:hypothetical protein